MGLIQKLASAVRGGSREILELAVDANGLRILAQEIHECEVAIGQAKQDWCRVSAERIRLKREAENLQSAIAEKERQAISALDHGQEDLAREVAQWIAGNEPVLSDLCEKKRQLEAQEAQLEHGLQIAIQEVQDYRRELRMAQAMASAQSATRKFADKAHILPQRLNEMQDSLQCIKERQQAVADMMVAAQSIDNALSGHLLDRRLAEINSVPLAGSAEAVLERIRKKRADVLPG